MTTSRIVRGTKIRIFVYFCSVVVILGLLACYNSTISQLDEIQKAVEVCHQQQENLSTQLQVISDYKLRLEKALKTEKADHAKSNSSLEQAIKEEKAKNEKISLEAKMRFTSLQQSYNLLETDHNDFKEKTNKIEQDQLDEINELRTKLKEVEKELETVNESKEKLKTEYLNMQLENENYKRQVDDHEKAFGGSENKTNFLTKQNIELKREIETLKERCSDHKDTIQAPIIVEESPDTVVREPQQQDNVLIMPLPNNDAGGVKSSSTASSVKPSSQGSLNGARPLALPTMTPKNNANAKLDQNVKIPQGVLPPPNRLPEKSVDDNEIPNNDLIDNRYKNQIEAVKENENKKHEELEKDNAANEVFENPNLGEDGIGFVDPIKQAERQNFNKQHIDNLALFDKEGQRGAVPDIAGADYKEAPPHDQLEENAGMDEGEDDDQDEYGDHLARHKEPAVRN